MRHLSRLLSVLLAFLLVLTPMAQAAQISRQHADTIVNGNLANANDVSDELNSLVNESNSQDTRLTGIESGSMTFLGVKTFSSAPIISSIKESVAGYGVNISGTRIYNGFANLSSVRGTFDSVDTSTDVVTLTSAHGLSTGSYVKVLADKGATLDTGLDGTTPYYFRSLTSTTFTLHPTSADASAGTNIIDIAAEGSGVRYLIGTPSALREGDIWVDADGFRFWRSGAIKTVATIEDTALYITGPAPVYTSASTVTFKSGLRAKSSTNTVDIKLTGDIAVSLAATGAGGLDTGVEAAGTWYYYYLIRKSSDGTTSVIASAVNESVSGTITYPSGYDQKRQLPFAVRNDGSSNIIPFYTSNDWWTQYDVGFSRTTGAGTVTSGVTQILAAGTATTFSTVSGASYIPPFAKIVKLYGHSTNANDLYFSVRPNGSSSDGQTVDCNGFTGMYFDVPLQNQSIDYKKNYGSGSMNLEVVGWKGEL